MSSPVYEFGPLNTVMSTWSIPSFFSSVMYPRCTVWLGTDDGDFPLKQASTILKLSFPEIRITDIAAWPGAVARATIVVSRS